MCGMLAPLSSASMAVTSTVSLVRTISFTPFAPAPRSRSAQVTWRLLREVGEDLHLAPSARHRIEHEPARHRKAGEDHQAGRQHGGRKARDHALLDKGHDDRDREHD